MTKFIDTDAGRQLLKDYFFNLKLEHDLIDPNLLEYASEWANFPILKDIQQIYEHFKSREYPNEKYTIVTFSEAVDNYLYDNYSKGCTAWNINFEEHFDRYHGGGADDKDYLTDYLEVPETFRNTVEYSDGLWTHKKDYLDSLKSLVS